VPPSLDRAIRAALERDPNARYENALQMAEAIEAGYHGEDTDTTRGLFTTGTEYATGAGLDTGATQALPRGNTMYEPPPSRRYAAAGTGVDAPATYGGDYAAREAEPRRDRNWGKLIAGLLALLLIAAAIYLALGLGSDADQIREGDVNGQAEQLQQFIQDHSE